tara:strand:- start:9370 stop:10284 length:915 start_codon:yes stop_codon:yes gene_type:complete
MISAKMPSNIALIKYMGKNDHNLPINSSLSYTLPRLFTEVTLKRSHSDQLITQVPLKEGGRQSFIKHFQMLKSHFGINENYDILSQNNFPAGTGLASSASSYAALTMATWTLAKTLGEVDTSMDQLASLSRLGSGSSIRSFYSPYCLWENDRASTVGFDWIQLDHDVLLLDTSHKKISSSEAHQRVRTSKLYRDRPKDALMRIDALSSAFEEEDWGRLYQITKDEFLQMHEMFHTATPKFSYFTQDTLAIIDRCDHAIKSGAQFMLTMDAGANLHFLYPKQSPASFLKFKKNFDPALWWSKNDL